MRKGFTVTLLTVAVAMMGNNAMSMAPVISNIKDIVVSDDTPVTGSNLFVYPDAIDLNSVVSDPDTSDSALIWSYYDENDNYLINATPSLDIVGGDTGLLPPAGKRIAGPLATNDDTEAVDSSKFTITVRNKTLSPVGGPNAPDPVGSGIINSMTDTVLFFVSDADQFTSAGVIIYTEDDGTDRLSPGGGIPELDIDFKTGANGWISTVQSGTASASQSGTSGLCLTVAAAGTNVVNWTSPYGIIDLTDNAVYEIRATLNTTQTTEDAIPFWDLGLINLDVFDSQGFAGANSYGANFYFLDNLGDLNTGQGGSQGIGRFRNEFVVFWTPLAVSFPSWRSTTTGAFQPTADSINDLQMSFRSLDNADTAFYGAESDSGTICLQQLQVFRHDLDSLVEGSTVYSDTSLASGDVTATSTAGDTSYAFSGGVLTATATGGGWLEGQLDIVPGTGTIDIQGSPQPAESWPLPWPSDTLYLAEVPASIPSPTTQTAGMPDLFMVMFEAHTQTYQQSYVLPNVKFLGAGTGGAGMPPVAPATATYKAFGYTNEASKSSFYPYMRPHVNMFNIPAILPTGTGAFSIHGITVKSVTF